MVGWLDAWVCVSNVESMEVVAWRAKLRPERKDTRGQYKGQMCPTEKNPAATASPSHQATKP